MIYLLYGSDTAKSRSKLHELVAGLVKKKPDALHVRLTEENFDESKLDELLGSSGLFSSKAIIEVDSLFKNKEAKEFVVKNLKEIAESENIFVFLEAGLDKKTLEKFEKNAEKVQEFELKEKNQRAFLVSNGKSLRDFNMFAITDAFGRRDKKNLWVLYTKASRLDVSAEEIHGLLFWQTKTMLVTSASKNAKEAGLNPFVYQKSQGFLRNYQTDELKKISTRLVSMYHNTRRGIVDFDVALEKFILEV